MHGDFVVGFAFTPDQTHVVLIRKERPDWQRGRLNGLGGAIRKEDGRFAERPVEAMVREFREEAGVETLVDQWRRVAILVAPAAQIFAYALTGPEALAATPCTDEALTTLSIEKIQTHQRLVAPLRWLIPMALDTGLTPAPPVIRGDWSECS